jgi:hypothetical protein
MLTIAEILQIAFISVFREQLDETGDAYPGKDWINLLLQAQMMNPENSRLSVLSCFTSGFETAGPVPLPLPCGPAGESNSHAQGPGFF